MADISSHHRCHGYMLQPSQSPRAVVADAAGATRSLALGAVTQRAVVWARSTRATRSCGAIALGCTGVVSAPAAPLSASSSSPRMIMMCRRAGFSAVILCCLASWRQDGENGRKMAENGRNLGEKLARNSGG